MSITFILTVAFAVRSTGAADSFTATNFQLWPTLVAGAAPGAVTLRRLVERKFAQSTQKGKRTRARPKKRVTTKTVRPGMWGGPHVGLNVTAARVEIEFDCAHGTIDHSIKLDNQGRFDAIGTWVPEGGPVSVPVDPAAMDPKSFSARYRGRVEGNKLWLRVTIPETGVEQNVMTLTYGKQPILEKCY